MSQHSELIAKLIALSEMLDEYEGGNFKWSDEAATAREAADALQALERVPMTEEQIMDMARYIFDQPRWPSTAIEVVRATEAHHGITPPESKG